MGLGALVIEGGGMKAAYANGVLSAFEAAGMHFDAVYGTSAGGALGAWFSAGQARYAEETWKYASDPRILSYPRWLSRRGPLLDHEALLDIVYVQEHPIDQKAIRACSHPVIVTAVDTRTGKVRYQDLRKGNIIAWLKATGRLPLASGQPVPIGGRLYLDGGIVDPIPARRAIADGHDHLTVVLNTPPGARKRDNYVISAYTARRYPALRHGILHHHDVKEEALAFLAAPPPGVRIDIVRPTRATGLSRLTRDLATIQTAIEQGRQDGQTHLARQGHNRGNAPVPVEVV